MSNQNPRIPTSLARTFDDALAAQGTQSPDDPSTRYLPHNRSQPPCASDLTQKPDRNTIDKMRNSIMPTSRANDSTSSDRSRFQSQSPPSTETNFQIGQIHSKFEMPHVPEEILEAIAEKLVSRPRHSEFQLTAATDLTHGRNSNPPSSVEDLDEAYNISVKALAHLTKTSKQFRRLVIPHLYSHISFHALSDERLLLLIETLESSISHDLSDKDSSSSNFWNASRSPSAEATRAGSTPEDQADSQHPCTSYGHFIQTIDLGPPHYPVPARRHILFGRLMHNTPNILGLSINTYTDTYRHSTSYPPVWIYYYGEEMRARSPVNR